MSDAKQEKPKIDPHPRKDLKMPPLATSQPQQYSASSMRIKKSTKDEIRELLANISVQS